MGDEPAADLISDKASISFTADKDGRIEYRGGNMPERAVSLPGEYIEITNDGGRVKVRRRKLPKKITKMDISEAMFNSDSDITSRINALASLFNVTE
jgi:hypothetical protein